MNEIMILVILGMAVLAVAGGVPCYIATLRTVTALFGEEKS